MLAAVILAAGASARMGTPKALLPYRGRTFLEHLLDVAQHPRIGLTRVVFGAGADDVRDKVKLDPASIIFNVDWRQGQLSSIQAALRTLPPEKTEGMILFLIDHPLITAPLVGTLIEQFDKSGKAIVIPVFHGRRGHPVIFRSSLYGELLAAPAEIGARAVVWAHAPEIHEVPTEEEGVVLNLNDPETLKRALGAA
jgi:molybdenum cofactor cytidylyltransferase